MQCGLLASGASGHGHGWRTGTGGFNGHGSGYGYWSRGTSVGCYGLPRGCGYYFGNGFGDGYMYGNGYNGDNHGR